MCVLLTQPPPPPFPHLCDCRELSALTRVVRVTDSCHPCLHNPVRPAIVPPSEQHMLVAAQHLGRGQLLGLYWGKTITHR